MNQLGRLMRRPLAVLSSLWLLTVVTSALLPGLLTAQDPLRQDLRSALQGPSWAHPLGTDRLGQDLLSRLVHGSASTLWGVLVAVAVSVVLGVALGLAAGYLGGVADAIVLRLSDALFAIPGIVILLIVVAVFPGDVTIAMATFGVILASGLIRVVRAATRSAKEELYIAAAKVSGLTGFQILRRHILPRLASLVIVQAALIASVTLVTQAGLAFLGFGPPPPSPSWGGMMDEARAVMTQNAWALVPPGLAVALTVVACGLLGDAVRDLTTQSWSSSKLAPEPAGPQGTSRMEEDTGGALLSVRRLSVAIPIRSGPGPAVPTTVVSDVSFDIGAGQIVGLVGESGCGKTVAALSVLGLVPGGGAITGGGCVFGGHDLTRAGRARWRAVRGRGIGYVAQDAMISLDPTVRAGKQLAEAVRRHTGLSGARARARVLDLLADVRLPDPRAAFDWYPHQMSGGIAQRVAIAFALAGSPRLLIADEPTTALDVTVQAEILALLRELSRERGMAVLIVTHDLGVVAQLCDRAVVMYAGQVVESCDVATLFQAPRHPYTRALLASDPHQIQSGRLPVIPGSVPSPAQWPPGCRFAGRCPIVTPQCRQAPVDLVRAAPAHVARCLHADEPAVQAVAG